MIRRCVRCPVCTPTRPECSTARHRKSEHELLVCVNRRSCSSFTTPIELKAAYRRLGGMAMLKKRGMGVLEATDAEKINRLLSEVLPVVQLSVDRQAMIKGRWADERTHVKHVKLPTGKMKPIELHADEQYSFTIDLDRLGAAVVDRPYTPGYTKYKDEGWMVVLSAGKELVDLKRRSFQGRRGKQQSPPINKKREERNVVERLTESCA